MHRRIVKRVLVVAHRGSSGVAPENTLAAFRQAVADGADMIELDVRCTRDGHLVVIHDRTVNRTTDGRGGVDELTLADVRRLDAGRWYDRQFAGERIPTLEEVFAILPPSFPVNIEVKTDGQRAARPRVAERLVAFLNAHGLFARVLVSSFDHAFLGRVHALERRVRIGVLYTPVRDLGRKPSTLARRVGAEAFICSIAQVRRRFVEDAHRHALTVACYSVNSVPQLRKAIAFDVDAIITDYPREMRAQFGE